jgi:hypothetical protein
MASFDYLETSFGLFARLLKLNQRVPRTSHWLEFKDGFFDAAFKV